MNPKCVVIKRRHLKRHQPERQEIRGLQYELTYQTDYTDVIPELGAVEEGADEEREGVLTATEDVESGGLG
jgi:hypothetical protein